LTNIWVLPIGIAKYEQTVQEGDGIVSWRGVKSNVSMMMSDSHFTSVRFQVTGDRRTRRMKNSTFIPFIEALVAKISKYKERTFLKGRSETLFVARSIARYPHRT
jgi:hypothetical protein